MILTFLKEMELNFSTSVNLLKPHSNDGHDHESGVCIMGSILAVASCFSYSIWIIIQAKMCKVYPCHYSSRYFFFYSFACLVMAKERDNMQN
ncbi:hypothetical protein KSP40_PGU017625 [Platanthera guangdongensis]|uniref:Uncharacterized protein n=1 Tax=Platanthera guangdongensis TaxID=2320717 RepID=A0ABR2MYP6_9ASPA